MAKPEWGVKRTCQSCGAVFYDLRRSPITCPKCGTEFDPEAVLKSRRSRPAAPDEAKPVVAPVEAAEEAEAAPEAEVEKEEGGEEEDEAAVIEDTSDLGEDEDDLDEVMENVDENEKE